MGSRTKQMLEDLQIPVWAAVLFVAAILTLWAGLSYGLWIVLDASQEIAPKLGRKFMEWLG